MNMTFKMFQSSLDRFLKNQRQTLQQVQYLVNIEYNEIRLYMTSGLWSVLSYNCSVWYKIRQTNWTLIKIICILKQIKNQFTDQISNNYNFQV